MGTNILAGPIATGQGIRF